MTINDNQSHHSWHSRVGWFIWFSHFPPWSWHLLQSWWGRKSCAQSMDLWKHHSTQRMGADTATCCSAGWFHGHQRSPNFSSMWPCSWHHSPCSQDPPLHWPSDCGRSGASPRKLANIGLHPTWYRTKELVMIWQFNWDQKFDHIKSMSYMSWSLGDSTSYI